MKIFKLLLVAIGLSAKDPSPVLPLNLVNDFNRTRADLLEAQAAYKTAMEAIWKVCGGASGVELDEKRDPKCKQKEPAK